MNYIQKYRLLRSVGMTRRMALKYSRYEIFVVDSDE